MLPAVIDFLTCPLCAGPLSHEAFCTGKDQQILDGITWCVRCNDWWPIEEELLELLPAELAYHEDRRQFYTRYERQIAGKGLREQPTCHETNAQDPRHLQQHHFDWYAANQTQSYSAYQQMPFWRIVDEVSFGRWKALTAPGGWLLDVGCAQGRSIFPFADLPLQLVGIDLSKKLVRQAIVRSKSEPHDAQLTFLVGDCSRLPIRTSSFDYVLVYGVLHHLPSPRTVCADIARVLKPGGYYFGSENNRTAFRRVFDWLQRVLPLWHEEAGEQPLISQRDFREWFEGTAMEIDCRTHVFAPPHLINLLGYPWGGRLLRYTDRIGGILPWLRENGGLVVIDGRHR